MNLKEFLDQNKVIMQSALAVLMWPDKNNQAKVFSNKINEKPTGKYQSKQRITEDDEARAKVVLLEVAEKIKAYASGNVPIVQSEKPITPPVKEETQIKKSVEKQPPVKRNLAAELEQVRNEK